MMDDLFHFLGERVVLLDETQRPLAKTPGVNNLCRNSPVMPAFSTICRGVNENTDSEMLESSPEGDLLTRTAHTCLGEWCLVQ